MRRLALLVLPLLAAAACTSDALDPQELAIRHAAAARELEFVTPPAVRRQTRLPAAPTIRRRTALAVSPKAVS